MAIKSYNFHFRTAKMSSDDSDEIAYSLTEELKNIRSVIHVTRQNIDALNAKFADFPQPPTMYIEEYQELTSKLHELEIKEQKLQLSEVTEEKSESAVPEQVEVW